MFHPDQLIGMEEADAVALLTEQNRRFRIGSVDDESFFGTCDYWPNRVTLAIQDGLVASYSLG